MGGRSQHRAESERNDSPVRRFVVLCHQRSGSNALTSALQRHPDVEMYGQLFNNSWEYRGHHRRMLSMPLFRAHPDSLLHVGPNTALRTRAEHLALRLLPRHDDVESYLDTFFARFGVGADAVGFKVHDLQLDDDDLATMLGAVDRVIVLQRRNLLRAAVSWAVALRTDVWVRGNDATDPEEPLHLDLDEIEWFMTKTRAAIESWRRLLDECGVDPLWLDFESVIEQQDWVPVLEFLGVDSTAELRAGTKKLAAPDYAHIANAHEIDRRLGSDDHGRLGTD